MRKLREVDALIRVVDKSAHPMSSKRGDVLVVKYSGWEWSQWERENPEWRIIRSAIPETLAITLVTPPAVGLMRKSWMIELTLLPKKKDFTGARPTDVICVSRDDFITAVRSKI
jgi:hypothetical protein